MALSEIEKLERRYAENPQGLTFAPLAEVHRKNGEVRRALDLLGPGLEIHPDYIPASIVLGRCHLDLGDVPAAEKAFLHVLSLDGENVIALKALADISERLLKFDDAERWLQTLLSVDRSNEDAREQLQRVEGSRRQAGVASSAEPSTATEVQTDAAPALLEDLQTSTVPEQPPEAAGARPETAAHFEEPISLEDSAQLEAPVELQASVEFESVEFEKPVEPDGTVEPIEGLVGREVDAPDKSLDEFRVETSEDIVLRSAGGSEFQMPDASLELSARDAQAGRAPFEEDASLAPSGAWEAPRAEPSEPDAAAPELGAPEPLGFESVESELVESEPVASEPVASEPVASEPGVAEPSEPQRMVHEPAAPEPVASEPVTSEPSVPDFPFHRRNQGRDAAPPPAPPKRSYSVGETGGRSVVHLFKGILSARLPAQPLAAPVRQAPAPGSAGAPTRPAADALSLSSVFGEEASETPPAVPASNQGAGSVSFDDFFTSPSTSPARTPRTPDPKSDDLDQFHAWLQNLKR